MQASTQKLNLFVFIQVSQVQKYTFLEKEPES